MGKTSCCCCGNKEDIRLIQGGLGFEEPVACYSESPTWIVDKAWDTIKDIADASLAAYLSYCKEMKMPHSYLLGLDILVTGIVDRKNRKIYDIRPTMLEGPCCNSYPACPNIFAYRLYRQLQEAGLNPDDYVTYPNHPTNILQKIVDCFRAEWKAKGKKGDPTVAVFTRSYPESEEETAHVLVLEAFKKNHMKAYRITPTERPYVKNGKLHVDGHPIDMCYRRIERIHVPMFYGWETAMDVIFNSPGTQYINPWRIDEWRSKTIEEKCFRAYEKKTGKEVSRPITLLGKEITPKAVKAMLETGGYALKRWNSTGGKGVFLHYYEPVVGDAFDSLYTRYDGRHMVPITKANEAKTLAEFKSFKEDASIQQLRTIDARQVSGNKRIVYDTRINALYNAERKEWDLISGMSRSVPCGPSVKSGNSLLTNVSSGADIAPLVMGKSKGFPKGITFGPLLTAMMAGKTECGY